MSKINVVQLQSESDTIALKDTVPGKFYLIRSFEHNNHTFKGKIAYCFDHGMIGAILDHKESHGLNFTFYHNSESDRDIELVEIDKINISYSLKTR